MMRYLGICSGSGGLNNEEYRMRNEDCEADERRRIMKTSL